MRKRFQSSMALPCKGIVESESRIEDRHEKSALHEALSFPSRLQDAWEKYSPLLGYLLLLQSVALNLWSGVYSAPLATNLLTFVYVATDKD